MGATQIVYVHRPNSGRRAEDQYGTVGGSSAGHDAEVAEHPSV